MSVVAKMAEMKSPPETLYRKKVSPIEIESPRLRYKVSPCKNRPSIFCCFSILRKSIGQSTSRISNEVLKLVEVERSLLTIIRTRQRNWMRHTMTGDSLQKEIIEGRMDCK